MHTISPPPEKSTTKRVKKLKVLTALAKKTGMASRSAVSITSSITSAGSYSANGWAACTTVRTCHETYLTLGPTEAF